MGGLFWLFLNFLGLDSWEFEALFWDSLVFLLVVSGASCGLNYFFVSFDLFPFTFGSVTFSCGGWDQHPDLIAPLL